MVRLAFMALIALGFVVAPTGEVADAQAQKRVTRKKTVKRKKKGRSVKRGKSVKRKAKTKMSKKKAAKAIKKGKLKFKVKAGLRNTNKVLAKAKGAVKIGTKGRADLRAAVVRQHAARKALAKGKRHHAFYLTRLSRKLAKGVIVANNMTVEADAEVLADPDAGDMEEIGGIIKEVEESGVVPAEDKILEDATVGVDQPDDLGEDETDEPEKELEMEKEAE